MGQQVFDLFNDRDYDILSELYDDILKGESEVYDLKLNKKKGDERYVRISQTLKI